MKRKRWVLPLLCILLLSIFPPLDAYGAYSVRIGFIDTGISTKHLEGTQVAVGKNYVFPNQDTQDREGHGTATAGMVLGSEKLGLAGSFAGAVLVPLVTIDKYASGVVKKSDISVMCQAIYEAIDVYGCRVINISMGVPEDAEELRRAVAYAEKKGVVVVSAVGNDHVYYPQRSYYPASYPTVIGVGAAAGKVAEGVPQGGRREGDWLVADFSQRNGVSVLAEGLNLATVTNSNAAEARLRSGTSYACAYVAGLCTRLLAGTSSLSPAEVRGILYAGAQEFGAPGRDAESGWGVVGLEMPSSTKVTRGMLVALLYESAGRPEVSSGGPVAAAALAVDSVRDVGLQKEVSAFTDVPAESYYAQAVGWAAETGIVKGYSSSLFGPDDEVSREQMAVIMARYAQYQGVGTATRGDLAHFVDERAVSSWARALMEWAVGVGLIRGKGNGILDPLGSATRAEAAIIMQRFFADVLR